MTRSGSGSGDGERKRRLIRSLDYLCVSRFRLRRLLAFLWRYSYDEAFEAYEPYASLMSPVPLLRWMISFPHNQMLSCYFSLGWYDFVAWRYYVSSLKKSK
jgi:hypothetical protein